jgi:hypothetical protein
MKRINQYMACVIGIGSLCACAGNQHPVQEARAHHLAEIVHADAMLYVDEVRNDLVLQQTEPAGATAFCSYRVGIEAHGRKDTQQETARQKYFEYEMQQDWKLVLNGDSIAPVFFHPMVRLNKAVREGVMVFEVPAGSVPHALVYDDTSGDWGKQLIILNNPKNYR